MKYPGPQYWAALVTVWLGLASAVSAAPPGTPTPAQKGHWAWKPPVRPAVPRVRHTGRVRTPVDAFWLARLEAAGLEPAAPAGPAALVRRLSFVLTGLPPDPADTAAYARNPTPREYDRLVEQYLTSPALGEHWGRRWLDVARYADTNGFEHDEIRPDAWRYRDYVVRAFNADLPYNQFLTEHLAGDELSPARPEAWIATGFHLLGPDMTDAASQAARRQHTLNDMTDTTALAFLGLTLACARCHDHKYEPLSQREYYAFQAFFTPARFRADLPIGTPEEQARYETALRGHQTELAALEARMAALAPEERAAFRQEKLALLPEDVQRAFATPAAERNAEQAQLVQRHGPALEPRPEVLLERLPEPRRPAFRSLMHDREALLKRQPAPAPRAVGLWEEGAAPPPTRILVRGELANPGAEVTPRFPAVLTAAAPNVAAPLVGRSSGRRSALAQWLTRPDHPLTARVFVNRVWQGVFGRGLVASASDFGVRGETPTHPALLDWLTSEFTAQGWRPRALLRLLVRSAVFQQAAVSSTETRRRDPENRWWSRMSRRRLEAEAIRDSLLAISGRLNRKAGGPGVFPPLPEEDRPRGTVWPVSPDLAEHRRRSLYLFVRRNLSFPGLEPFDSPDSNLSCARRETTITAPQALALWNGEEAVAAARGLASRVLAGASEPTARIALAYRLALGRPPIGEEQALAEGFLRRQTALLADRAPGALLLPDPLGKEPPTAGTAAWTDYCLALLNSNEFLYVD